MTDIRDVLKKLEIADTGSYENHFYILPIADSNEYAKMYTKLDENAINTEYPNFEHNTNGTTTKVINYFELDIEETTYNIFLFGNFEEDSYYLKITEKL